MPYRIYIDEVGNHRMKNIDHPDNRFLSLTGVIVDYDYVRTVVHPQLEELKAKYFPIHNPPDEPVVLHREDIVHMRQSFALLREPQLRQRFDADLTELLSNWEYSVITICLDKLAHFNQSGGSAREPYHYCLSYLLDGFVSFLKRMNAQGDMMIEARGSNEDRALKDEFSRLYEQGTERTSEEDIQSVIVTQQISVKAKSSNVAGLQLADIIAHDSRNEILQLHSMLDTPLRPFAQRIIQILQMKYDQDEGAIQGRIFI